MGVATEHKKQFQVLKNKTRPLTLLLPKVAKDKFRPNFQISFSKILTNKYHYV